MPTSGENGIHPSSSYNLRSRPLPKTAGGSSRRAPSRSNKENVGVKENAAPVPRGTRKGVQSKLPVPAKSRIPQPRTGKTAPPPKTARTATTPTRRKVPDFEKLHKNWSKKFEQGKAVAKKPCTQSNAFDLTRPGTRFRPSFFDGSVEKKEPRRARTRQDSHADEDDGFEIDAGALNNILNGEGLGPEHEAPAPANRATLAGTGMSSNLSRRSAASRQTLGHLPTRGMGRPNNSANVVGSRVGDRKAGGRKSFLDEQRDAGLTFEASADALASILNNTGLRGADRPALGGGRATIAGLSGLSSKQRQSGRFNPTTGRASIYYQKPRNQDNTKVYSEFAKRTLSRLTLDGNTAKIDSALIDSLLPDNRGSIYIKQNASENGSRLVPGLDVQHQPSTAGRVQTNDHLKRARSAMKTPGTASRVPNPNYQGLQGRQELSCSPSLRETKPALTPARRIPASPGGQSQRNVRWADVLSSPPEGDRGGHMSTKDVATVLNFGEDGSEQVSPETRSRLKEVEKLEAETVANRQKLTEMEEIERELELEIARLHQTEAQDHVTQSSDHMMHATGHVTQSSDHMTHATDHVMLDHVPTKQTADHMDPVRIPKDASSRPIASNAPAPPVPPAPASNGPSLERDLPAHPAPREAWNAVSMQDQSRGVNEHVSNGQRIAGSGLAISEQDVYTRSSDANLEQRLQNSELRVGHSAAISQSNRSGLDRVLAVNVAKGGNSSVASVMARKDRFQQAGMDERLLAIEQDVGSLSSESTEFFRVVHPAMPVDSPQNVRPPSAHHLQFSSGSGVDLNGKRFDGMREEPKPIVQPIEQRVRHRVENSYQNQPQAGFPWKSTVPAISMSTQNITSSTNSMYGTGQFGAVGLTSMPVSAGFTGFRQGQRPLAPPRPDKSTQQNVPFMSLGQPITHPSMAITAPNIPSSSTNAHASRSETISSNAYPDLSQIRTPQPLRARGTSFRRAMQGPQSISTPLHRSSAHLVPPPIQTPLAMRQGAMQKLSILEQSHQRSAMIVSPSAVHLQRDGQPRIQPVASTAPPLAAFQEPRSLPSQVIPRTSISSFQPAALQQPSANPGTPQPSFRLPVASTVPSIAATQVPLNHHPVAVPSMSGSSSFQSAMAQQPIVHPGAPHASFRRPVTNVVPSVVANQAPTSYQPQAISSMSASASFNPTLLLQSSTHPGVPQQHSATHVSTTDSALQPRPSHTVQDPTKRHPSLTSAQSSDVQASLSLTSNLGRPAPVHPPSLRQQVNKEKDTIGQMFHHVLLDEECALYACRLKGRFTPEPSEPRPLNPIAQVLLYGDDMHFVPLADREVLVASPSGSAFSNYLLSSAGR